MFLEFQVNGTETEITLDISGINMKGYLCFAINNTATAGQHFHIRKIELLQ